jgi:hypothetical protein
MLSAGQDELRNARETLGRLKAGGYGNTISEAMTAVVHIAEKLLVLCERQGEALEKHDQQLYELKHRPTGAE